MKKENCPNCGEIVSVDDKHCKNCGALNDVEVTGKTRCRYCKSIVIGSHCHEVNQES